MPQSGRAHDGRMPEGARGNDHLLVQCSDHDVREAAVAADVELRSTAQVYACLGRFVHCGPCCRSARRVLQQRRAGQSLPA